ncbi:hypothetical protein HW115_17710 [Verrucomicrobiaceae bacterium N1E253]|uniref:Thioredoxin-like fold domain-containing protein n=1 Tax=Oceaniferula marina TaxID=2748318 RepID=A0A851GI48_9BACT|nr:hypothetical protein [Oceaniferula marina]
MEYYNKSIADNDKVEFLHVSQDDSRRDALNWARSAKFPWLTVLSSKSKTSGLAKYDSGTPSYILIDKDGNVLASDEKKCIKKIKELTGK